MANPEYLKVPVEIGEQTCIGGVIGQTEPPFLHGNRFYLIIHQPRHLVVPVLNMTAENLDAAANGWMKDEHWWHTPILEDGKVWTSLWEEDNRHWCLINDGRIPADWYEKKLTWFGGDPSLDLATAIYEKFGGDQYGELERWTDEKSYWMKRGWEYTEGSGILKKTILAESRRLDTRWVCDGIVSVSLDSSDSRDTSPG